MPSMNIWTNFDFGTVEAENIEQARAIAIKNLNYDFQKANDALAHSDNTKGFSLNFDESQVEIKEMSV